MKPAWNLAESPQSMYTLTFIRVHLIQCVGGLVGQHAHVRAEFLHKSLDHHLRCGSVGHADALGGHLLTIGPQALEVEPHDALEL